MDTMTEENREGHPLESTTRIDKIVDYNMMTDALPATAVATHTGHQAQTTGKRTTEGQEAARSVDLGLDRRRESTGATEIATLPAIDHLQIDKYQIRPQVLSPRPTLPSLGFRLVKKLSSRVYQRTC